MGGRGTFAVGKPTEFTYRAVGEIEGVKVLEGLNGKHGLPESAHSGRAYIKLKPDGSFHEMRFYNKNHVLFMEIAYHAEKALIGNNHKPVLHYHLYDAKFSMNAIGPFQRSEAKRLTKSMKKRYQKFFQGVQL